MNILINNQHHELSGQSTISNVISHFGATGAFAVALNGCFVSKTQYETTEVSEGDKVEILSPISGG